MSLTNDSSATKGKICGGEANFVMFGDETMSRVLAEVYNFGTEALSGFPMIREDPLKFVILGDTWYRVELWPMGVLEALRISYRFAQIAQVLILVYNVSRQDSFREMVMAYDQIPKLKGGVIMFERYTPVPFNCFPKVIIGCKHPDCGAEVVEDDQVQEFIKRHPDCIFAGKCEPDVAQICNVDEVIRVAVEAYHRLRKEAIKKVGFNFPGAPQEGEIQVTQRSRMLKSRLGVATKRLGSCVLL